MRVSGFELVDENGGVLAKSDGSAADLVKAHVKGYVRKDGVQVKEHDDSRPDAKAAQPGAGKPLSPDHDFGAMLGSMKDGDTHHFANSKFSAEKFGVTRKGDRFHFDSKFDHFQNKQPKEGHGADAMAAKLAKMHASDGLIHAGSGGHAAEDHPHVVGQFSNHKVIGKDGKGEAAGDGDPTHPSTTSVSFGGRQYSPTGKTGKSSHDQTPVHEFEAEDGHRVWGDKQGRVHADSTSEVDHLRKLGEQHGGGEKGGKAEEPEADMPDEHNPKFALQTFPTKSLQAAASGEDDLNHRAKVQLAARGLDSDGKWVGFDQAEKHHGLSKKDFAVDPDEDQTHAYMQTLHNKVLSAAAKGKADLNEHARKELEARGTPAGKSKGSQLRKAILFCSASSVEHLTARWR